MQIRYAGAQDFPSINRIYNQAIEDGLATADTSALDVEYHKQWLEGRDMSITPVLVAENAAGIAGYVTLSLYRFGRPAVAHVREISYYVQRDARRQGIATALLQAAYDACLKIGVTVLLTFVIADNKPSVLFLEKHGFALWGTFPGIVEQNEARYDHVVLGRHLGSQS